MNDQAGADLSVPADSVRVIDPALLLRLEHAVAGILTGKSPDETLLVELLEAIGSALRWPAGAIWRPHGSAGLRCVATWCAAEFVNDPFVSATQFATLHGGVGLPGRVWQSGQPA